MSGNERQRAQELLDEARRHSALRRTESAIPLLNEALGLDPGNADLRYEVGALAYRQGNMKLALAHLEACTKLEPGRRPAWSRIGACHMLTRHYEDAVHAFAAAARDAPAGDDAWWRLGRAQRLSGAMAAARTTLVNAAAAADAPPEAHHELAVLALESGREAEAERVWRFLARPQYRSPVGAAARGRLAELQDRTPLGADARRVAFHVKVPFHEGILAPGHAACRRRHRVLFSHDVEEIVAFDPEIVVGCDTQLQALKGLMPTADFVQTRHGMGSKGHAISMVPTCDYFCLSQASQASWFEERGALPRKGFWPIGYLQLDPLLNGSVVPARPPRRAGLPLVLFAPTIGDHVSSLGMLGDDPVAALRPDPGSFDLAIKPHPETAERHPTWMKALEASARRHPGVTLVTGQDVDVLPWVVAADLMVTDCSSVMFFMVALDRPLVLMSNPARHAQTDRFDPSGPEWRWRAIGSEVEDALEAPGAIGFELGSPRARAGERMACRGEMFGDLTDGRAGERLAERIAGLARTA